MTKAKISEYDAVASNNTDVNGVNIAEGCPPSGMNNMGREIMAALKRFQVGSDGDGVTVGGNLVVSGSSTVNTFTAGPVSATTLNTSGAVVFNDAGADVDFRVEGDTDANLLFVDASADAVGVGTNAPTYRLTVVGTTDDTTPVANFRGYTTGADGARTTILRFTSSDNNNWANARYDAQTHIWHTNGSEKARIDSSGNLLVGTTSTSVNSGNTGVVIFSSGRTAIQRNVDGSDSVFQAFGNAGAAYIQGDGDLLNTNNSYGSLSDVKLKQDIVDAGSQWDDIKGLRVRKYRFKSNPDAPLHIGLVAQEVEEVSAGLVDESPDYEEVTRTREVEKTRVVTEAVLDDDGNEIEPAVTETYTEEEEYTERVALDTTTKSVKYSVLYMKAVKALQEAMERIETLEAKVAALENA